MAAAHSVGRIDRIDRFLIERGILDEASLARLQEIRATNPQRLSRLIVDTGLLSADALYGLFSDATGLPLWDGEGEPFLDEGFPEGFLDYNRVLPVRRGEQAWLVLEDPEDDGLIDMLLRLRPEAHLALAPPQKLKAAFTLLFGEQGQKDDEEGEGFAADDIGHLKDLALEAPIIRLVNEIITAGIEMHASDIHLEPSKQSIDLRYRVDGVLHARQAPGVPDYPAVASRIKILANLDIAERRLPQDGRIRMRTGGRDVDIRVSTLPTPHGEDIVLRLLDQKQQNLSLEATGLTPRIINLYRANLERSNGLILVTGPTGSGKSTTLYSGLAGIIDGTRKIITVEDPVEYEMAGISQIQVNEGAGLTFASVLRSILRHDPDVIFIGEIRDRETAEIAVQASLTGHLVLSTIHTNSATGAIGRFLDMGVADYLLSSSLVAISAQRLVRRLCEDCKRPELPDEASVERFGLDPKVPIYHAVGCPKCGRTGYKGRTAIAEMLEMTPALRQQILHDPSSNALDEAARREHFRTMIDDGVERALAGLTTLEEVMRVAG
ncbi:MAG TPA: GspE/PulE family protein [Rhodocyclaceae bacterium]